MDSSSNDNIETLDKRKRGRPCNPVPSKKVSVNTGALLYEAKKGDEIPKSFLKNIDEIHNEFKEKGYRTKKFNRDKEIPIEVFYEFVSNKLNIPVSQIKEIYEFRSTTIHYLINNRFLGKIIFKNFFTFELATKNIRMMLKSGEVFKEKFDDIRDFMLSDLFLKNAGVAREEVANTFKLVEENKINKLKLKQEEENKLQQEIIEDISNIIENDDFDEDDEDDEDDDLYEQLW